MYEVIELHMLNFNTTVIYKHYNPQGEDTTNVSFDGNIRIVAEKLLTGNFRLIATNYLASGNLVMFLEREWK